MAGARKIPMHRATTPRGGTARSVPHPGVNGADKNTPTFISPYQPPPSYDDFAADIDPTGWKRVEVAGFPFRVKTPQPQAIDVLSFAWSKHARSDKIAHQSLIDFVARYTHPEDLAEVLGIMADPDDARFEVEQFHELVKQIATVGTARPFWPSLGW
jgi:hypothetical protein